MKWIALCSVAVLVAVGLCQLHVRRERQRQEQFQIGVANGIIAALASPDEKSISCFVDVDFGDGFRFGRELVDSHYREKPYPSDSGINAAAIDLLHHHPELPEEFRDSALRVLRR